MDLLANAVPGAVAGWLLGLDGVGVVALAGATYISSSGIIARLLGDLRRLGNRETPSVLSVLVVAALAATAVGRLPLSRSAVQLTACPIGSVPHGLVGWFLPAIRAGECTASHGPPVGGSCGKAPSHELPASHLSLYY
ncbi:hypothetical protein [Nonomuraea basaltis]|uniref:hypothetical protein n=1 Tax=Nonomuraea basaltis TaxID=2495887 RepID=UPI001F10C861|nr:hypothetical protein [Nonomuraea basaltis]